MKIDSDVMRKFACLRLRAWRHGRSVHRRSSQQVSSAVTRTEGNQGSAAGRPAEKAARAGRRSPGDEMDPRARGKIFLAAAVSSALCSYSRRQCRGRRATRTDAVATDEVTEVVRGTESKDRGQTGHGRTDGGRRSSLHVRRPVRAAHSRGRRRTHCIARYLRETTDDDESRPFCALPLLLRSSSSAHSPTCQSPSRPRLGKAVL